MVLNFHLAFQNPFPSFHIYDIVAGITCAVALKLFVYYKGKNAKKYRQGVEYGSARWGTAKDIEPFIDPVFENKYHTDTDGTADCDQPPEAAEICPK